MADVNRPKIQLRPGLSINGDKTPSPATKLLINHGKPNFTIQKSPKTQNGNANPLSPPVNANNNNNNEFVVKSTTFNGIFKPSNISPAVKQTLPAQNGLSNSNNNNNNAVDNEAAKVVLRRAKVVPTEVKEAEGDENVPEFILRQRRIQERLANQNILDFENRRSGYFTQVMISPSSPNRQSFVETMASPAVKPGLEIPPPAPEHQEEVKEEVTQEHQEQVQQQEKTELVEEKHEECIKAEPVTLNGHDAEEEEVAKAIEEVNKAVEGEDDDKTEIEEMEEHKQEAVEEKQESQQEEPAHVEAVVTSLAMEEETPKEEEKPKEEPAVEPVAAVVTSLAVEEEPIKPEDSTKAEESPKVEESPKTEEAPKVEETVAVTNEVAQQNGHHETEVVVHQTNGVEEPLQNGHSTHEITISHTNGLNSPTIPSPDPKGEKGVNFEPKTVVSFSQELGNDVNKYPDTVKVVKEGQTPEVDPELKELTKLKFEIKADDENIEVKPVLITEPVTN